MVSFPRQIKHLWRYKLLIRTLLGARKAERLVNKATFVVSAGTNDILFNYLAASNQSGAIGMPQYENYLIARLANYTQVPAHESPSHCLVMWSLVFLSLS